MSNEIPTTKVKPWGDDQGDFVIINEADFDPEKHELFEEDVPGDKKLTVAEIREALTERGIDFDPTAKKAALQALLEAAG